MGGQPGTTERCRCGMHDAQDSCRQPSVQVTTSHEIWQHRGVGLRTPEGSHDEPGQEVRPAQCAESGISVIVGMMSV